MCRISVQIGLLAGFVGITAASTEAFAQRQAAVRIEGQVQAGGGPLANFTVTLARGEA